MTAKKSDVWKSVGRRKSSIARVLISTGKGEITINRIKHYLVVCAITNE